MVPIIIYLIVNTNNNEKELKLLKG